jgi:hypothetical protein
VLKEQLPKFEYFKPAKISYRLGFKTNKDKWVNDLSGPKKKVWWGSAQDKVYLGPSALH